MTLLHDAIAAYGAAARLLSSLTQARIDLLEDGTADLHEGATVETTGYKAVSPVFSVCVPDGSRALVRSLRPHQDALRIESDYPDWLSLEGWLPDATSATRCVVEADLVAGRVIVADVFVRVIGEDGHPIDGPSQPWTLDGRNLTVAELSLDPDEHRRRKVVVMLRRPPAEVLLRQLALVPV